jgi:RHS repeat-associated protein
LTNLWHSLTANGTVLAGFDYTYDAAARRRSMRTAGLPAPGLHEYGYDRQYQLRQATYPPGYSFASTGFQYDAKGNRLATTGAASVGYTANHLDQYTNVAGALLTYHSGGALRTHGDRTYGYDAENQLTQAGGPGLDARYRYDATGRRIETEVNGVITRFAYDGGRILGEYDAAGNLLRKLIHGDGVDEPLRLESASAKFYYHADALGSIHCLTDASGAKVESYAYDVFGKPAALSALGNRYYWTAREYDAETQLYHHRIRQYDPGLGRFLQPDPLGYLAGLNLYRYCDNDPVNWLDPYGLDKGGGWGPLDWLQGALDIGGLIPVIGEPLDLINAGISAARGDYVAAGLSLGAMLPVGGQAATAAKLGLKYGDEVASAANNVGRYANHTDAQFLREIASRAEAKVGGTGAVAGTHKHAYADRLLERYQSMTGQRQHLLREQSYLNGQPVPRGTAGSARPDVYDPGSGAVYDYKFTVNPGRGIPARQQGNNARNLPNVTSQTEINP